MSAVRRRSAWLLWLCAPALLGLSLYRPFATSQGRSLRMPTQVGAFTQTERVQLTAREHELLGTDDAAYLTYQDPQGGLVFVVVVFHQHNWKSVHPPHLCLRGSNMRIERDEVAPALSIGDRMVAPGRIVTHSLERNRPYLSLFLYGADGLCTGSYAEFVQHHVPRALLRRSAPGYLLRVEAWHDDPRAEPRCREFVAAIVPALEALLQ